MISVQIQGKPFNITVIQAYAPTSNAEESEVEWFYEDLQDLLELTPKKDVLFIIGDWNAKVGSQETPGVRGKFGLGIQNEAGQRLIEFCQENALVIANILFQQHKRRLCTWASPDGQLRNQIDYIRLLLLPSLFLSIRVCSNESALHIRWPRYGSFSSNISPSNGHSGLFSFRINWLDLLAVQGILKSLLQHHSSKASILWHSAFFIVQLSHPNMTTEKTIALTWWTFVGKGMSLLFNMESRGVS